MCVCLCVGSCESAHHVCLSVFESTVKAEECDLSNKYLISDWRENVSQFIVETSFRAVQLKCVFTIPLGSALNQNP